jgi:hypothetical protein
VGYLGQGFGHVGHGFQQQGPSCQGLVFRRYSHPGGSLATSYSI